jgi:5-methylcytosine-specific restriction endonuclease McrA
VTARVGRNTGNWKRISAAFKRDCTRTKRPCWLCCQPIDYALPFDDPFAFSIDHFYPVSKHPELAEVPANLRASHLDCNKRRGNRDPRPSLGATSRRW